jgi:electron transfer flavoprotein beta subunit
MRAIVPVKRVVDYAVKVRVAGNAVDLNAKMSMNPFCEIAVEESIRLKDKGLLSEVVAVSIGPTQCQETLRQALAMGADRAILIKTDMRTDSDLQPLAVAKILAKLVEKESPLLVMMGKQSIDGDNNQTGQLLAGLLSWPQATFASAISFNDLKSSISVSREVDNGIQTVSMNLPAVVTTDLRLNTPRFATLPNLMKAKKKPMEILELQSLNVDILPRVKVSKVEDPPARKGGRILGSVDELVNALRIEAKVL